MQVNASHSDTRLIAMAQKVAAVAATLTAIVGALVLAGWVINLSVLESLWTGQTTMKPLTALALLFGAAALWLRREFAGARQRQAALICAGVVAGVGAAILLEYLLGLNLGIDQALFGRALLVENSVFPGRPSPITAWCLLLLGLALLLLDSRPSWLAPSATLVALLVGGLALVGYAYDVTSLYQVGANTPIAFHTALVIVVLALGLLAVRPKGPILGVLTTGQAGSVLGRQLLPAVFIVPFVLGGIRLYGQRLGLYDTGFGVALLVTGNIVVFAGLVYTSARLLNHADAKREAIYDALRLSQENQRLMLDSIKDHAIFLLDTEGRVATWNAAAERIKGYTAAEIIGQHVSLFYLPEEVAAGKPQRLLDLAAANGSSEEEGLRVRKDGTRFWAIADTAALRDEHGVLRGYSKVTRDITERRQAESALREREERLRVLADATPNGLIIVADSGQITWANQRAEALFGYGHAALLDRSIDELVPQRYRDGHGPHRADFAADRRVRLMGAGRDLFGQRQDGSEFPVEIGLSPVETSQGLLTLASIIDITERKRAEEALRQLNVDLEARVQQRTADLTASEVKFRTMFDVLPVGVSILDEKWRLVDANPAIAEILQISSESLASGAYSRREFVHPDGSLVRPEEFPSERAVREQRPIWHMEMSTRTDSGDTIWIDASAAPLPVAGLSAVVVTTDLTERKRIEEDLRQSNERFAKAFHSSATALTITRSADGLFVDVNDGFLSLFGYRRDEVIGRRAAELNIVTDLVERAAMGRQFSEHGSIHNYETVRRTKSGALRNVLLSADAVELNGEAHILTTMLDISDRKNAEAALRESEDKFSKAFHASGAGIVISRAADGLILEANDSYLRLIGCNRDEVIGRTTLELGTINPEDRQNLTAAVREQGHVRNIEINFLPKTGEARTVVASIEQIVIGEQDCLLSVLYDITERKLIQQALATERDQLQALLDNIPDTIYFKDRASRFTRVNLAQARILGVASPDLAIGKTDADFQPSPLAAEFFAEEQRLLASGQPLVDRVEFNPTPAGEPRWLSATKVPLKDDFGQVVGLVGISRDVTRRVKAEETLQRLNQQLGDRVRELSLLNKLDEQLQACLTLEETYQLTAQIMGQLTPQYAGALYVVAADGAEVGTAVTWGVPAPETQAFAADDCWALRRGQLHLVDGSRPGLACRHALDLQASAMLCMPLIVQGQPLGIVHLRAPAAANSLPFADALLQVVRVVADSLALTWANLTLRDTLRQQAIRDPLTGLFNRRFMEESLARELQRAQRLHQSVGMIMLDVDHFKQVNDHFGHEAGDSVLRAIGRLLHDSSRGSDIPCRFGGEEFLLIMPDAPVEICHQRADQIRRAFADMQFEVSGGQAVRATLSLGVAAYPQHGDVLEAVVRAADGALYQAKESGRDRTVIAPA